VTHDQKVTARAAHTKEKPNNPKGRGLVIDDVVQTRGGARLL